MNIEGCSAIVTGGASGLGEATVRRLSSAGARVCIFDLNEERGQRVSDEIDGQFVQVDVCSEGSVLEGLERVESSFGTPRILVNCAGIAIGQKITSKGLPHSLEDFQRVININLVGTFNCIRLVSTSMTAADTINGEERGVIINTASVAAYDGQIGQVAYSASKGGIVGMTLPIARDLARDGVRVNTIAPGIFHTPLMDNLPEEVQKSLGASVPFPARLGDPSEFAALVEQICENAYMNGETIRLDGAIRLPPR